eukprot:TRINITY_DN4060_c0_g1_i5.p1 TRINITY_DN4060_c0_g1~~TRINITY_DN4060_c0_g1_i5.p1  ORF type:complete len:206 (-),score=82.33 TRINITY_DN4060_c0_g1_i5:109-726(-)
MAKGGKGKGGGSKATTIKPWLKKSAAVAAAVVTKTKVKGGGKGKGGAIGKKKEAGSWVFVPAGKSPKSVVSNKVGKGKGKGKGKRKGPAGLQSKFWEKKIEEENREELGAKTYSGTVSKYFFRQGWGLIAADNFNGLPKKVKEACEEAAQKAEEAGKENVDKTLIYFRKPDINHQEGFKVAPEVAVTFSLYVDEKGAGARDVSPA